LREAIFSRELVLKFKKSEADFTRNRKQPFVATLLFMLNLLRRSLVIEIDGFVRHLSERLLSGDGTSFTSSAFIQNRKKIDPEVFNHLSGVIVENFYTDSNDTLKYFRDFRILAVDGSWITLPYTSDLKKSFGIAKNNSLVEVVQAKASVLYDVLNELVLDTILANLDQGERDLALQHQHQWKEGDLIIYDRGYPSYDFIYEHVKAKTDYLIRMTADSSAIVKAFLKGGKTSIVTDIFPGKNVSFKDKEYTRRTPLKVRLIRVELSTGEAEVLVTSLFDSRKYPAKMFKELYFLRWGIETFYDELKNKLKVEYFTGYSEATIRQDFLCAIFISNLQSVMVNDLEEELTEQNKGKKYDYKVNTNLSYGFLKNRILELLYKEAPLDKIFNELEALFLKHTIPIRNNRTNTRNKDRFKTRIKPKVTKNQRDAI
jgi:hypothetical protein